MSFDDLSLPDRGRRVNRDIWRALVLTEIDSDLQAIPFGGCPRFCYNEIKAFLMDG